jgi:cell division protein FtsB
MQYLFGQILTCLLMAGLLGLLIGWLLWGMSLRRARERAQDMEQRVSRLSGFPARLADLEGTHAAFLASRTEEEAKLKARIAELENSEPLKARAAAATVGFYDPIVVTPAPPPPPDHVREFEKRIEELRAVEESKNQEITQLRGHLASIETLPDPDTRRQILSAAKNAEISHLRSVLNSLFEPLKHGEVAGRAYSYAEERGFQGGSPNEDWIRAERDLHFGRLAFAWESCRTGAMY